MAMVNFWKMNGAGNDFVVLDNRTAGLSLSREQIAQICHRQRGVGADGLLAVEPAQHGADHRMRYYNADGGEAEMCGNGARCFARFVKQLAGGDLPKTTFETIAGVISAEFFGDEVRIELSEPGPVTLDVPLDVDGTPLLVSSVNTGVPHAVVLVDSVATLPASEIRRLGAALRYHEHFKPAGTNVNFVEIHNPGEISIRTYERGVEDETLACGTGMVASALVVHSRSGVRPPIAVTVAGGETLAVDFIPTQTGSFTGVTLRGPAEFTFTGQLSID